MSAFDKTVMSLIPQWPTLDPLQRVSLARSCAEQVRRQVGSAPMHVRLGLWTLFAIFHVFLLVNAFDLRKMTREDALMAFSTLPIPMLSSLERALRSMALLFYFEQPEVLTALGEETLLARQAAFRSKRNLEHASVGEDPREITRTQFGPESVPASATSP